MKTYCDIEMERFLSSELFLDFVSFLARLLYNELVKSFTMWGVSIEKEIGQNRVWRYRRE